MNNATPQETSIDRATHLEPERAEYRCVCGHSLPVDSAKGGTCAACGRAISAAAAHDVSMATIAMPTAGREQAATNEPADENRIGTLLEHFRIVDRLGQGGMGTVYRALDESLQRYVALKVISTTGYDDGDSAHVERLLQEARAQARVNHANVVHIYFVSRDRRAPFLAMELVGGPTLAARLKQQRLPFAEVVRIGLQVAQALKHAADYDIVHGDIKPGNILLSGGRDVKLSDFGLARRLSAANDDEAALVGGTPNYLSPEAARGLPTDIRSDMYSLGVMLFEMTFGRLPYSYSGNNLQERLDKHADAPVEFPFPWPEDIPEDWKDLLERLLAKDPADRFTDYDEFITQLREMQPVALPKAGRLVRGLAWTTDLLLGFGISGIIQLALFALVFLFRRSMPTESLQNLVAACSSAIVPFLAIWGQYRWRTSPGRRLFQIRVVDRHGLPPPARTFAPRTIVRMLPFWTNSVVLFSELLNLTLIRYAVGGLGTLVVLADAGCAFFHRQGLAIHDMVLGTHVVLDARHDGQDDATDV